MLISEVFKTIQGEGTYTGHPVVFVRTSGCNLRCVWCDTPYASWNPEGENYKIVDLVNRVTEIAGNCKSVVISGGEPMIQKELPELISRLKAKDFHITIETAGTLFIEDLPAIDLWSISPKMQNSYPGEKEFSKEYKMHSKVLDGVGAYDAILKLIATGIEYQIKFVVQNGKDLQEIELFHWGLNCPASNIFLMPEGRTRIEVEEKKEWLVNKCIEKGYIFTSRLHVEIWNDKRGV